MPSRGLCLLLVLLCCSGLLGAQGEPEPPGFHSGSRLRFVNPEKRWAVVVGISNYEYLPRSAWLLSGDKDAAAFAEFLRSPRGGAIPVSQLKLLLNEEATTKNVRLALDHLITNVRPGDVATIFFAGHGQIRRLGTGEAGYLLTYDSEPEHLSATALPMDELKRYVDFHLGQASQVVVITDACHAGALLSEDPPRPGQSRSINEHLQALGQREGVLNIMACRRDQVAIEDPRLGGHGVLTYALLRALNGDGTATADGIVRTHELLQYISRQIPRLTDQEQHPRYGPNFTDEFPLANLNLEGPKTSLPPSPLDVLQAQPSGSSTTRRSQATLRVLGARADSELYLIKNSEQRSVGRPLTDGNVLVVDALPYGTYQLVMKRSGEQLTWELTVDSRSHVFDLRSGELR